MRNELNFLLDSLSAIDVEPIKSTNMKTLVISLGWWYKPMISLKKLALPTSRVICKINNIKMMNSNVKKKSL